MCKCKHGPSSQAKAKVARGRDGMTEYEFVVKLVNMKELRDEDPLSHTKRSS